MDGLLWDALGFPHPDLQRPAVKTTGPRFQHVSTSNQNSVLRVLDLLLATSKAPTHLGFGLNRLRDLPRMCTSLSLYIYTLYTACVYYIYIYIIYMYICVFILFMSMYVHSVNVCCVYVCSIYATAVQKGATITEFH